jgi:DNA ligase-1
VHAFSRLLDALIFSPQRHAKLRLMARYFIETPDPDRGWGLAALTGTLTFAHAKPAVIRALIAERVDPFLFDLSYDYVGDLAETVALLWPGQREGEPPRLHEVVMGLASAERSALPAMLAGWLDRLDVSARFALLKLITSNLRIGVSARLAKIALAEVARRDVAEIEELWHALSPPFTDLFAWVEGRGARPTPDGALTFKPMMLATPLEDGELPRLKAADFVAEWKWDGVRVQLARSPTGEAKLFSRTGDDISAAFPEIVAAIPAPAVLDGELLIVRDGIVAPFNDLQQRLGRKAPSRSLLSRFPAHVRLYDVLFDGEEDVRALPLARRRARLEAWYARCTPSMMDLSPLLPFSGWTELTALRAAARQTGMEGLMLKRHDSPYLAGRPKGPWLKWKRDPLTLDCVLMYAQRGHGKRSSYYSDYTFGCWRPAAQDGNELVPVGKAYFGFTDEELRELDNWVRRHTVERFGPVRAVEPRLVLEIAFDGVQRSGRHKSGVALRFPRIRRIRWDKPAAEADHLAALTRLLAAELGAAGELGAAAEP